MLHNTGQKAWRSGHRMNGDLLGYKFGVWEGGHRVPFIARWPGKIQMGSISDHLISQVDLAATFAAIVDRELVKGEAPDSINQLANFTGSLKAPIRKTLILTPNSPKHLSVRHEQWVYIPQQGSGGFQGKKEGDHLLAGPAALEFSGRVYSDVVDGEVRAGAPPAQLYNLAEDPYQTTNVYSQHPEVVSELETILLRYRSQIPSTGRVGWINLKQ
jgi:arylsulfatase A